MSEPIERFRNVIAGLSEADQRNVIPLCHLAIGPGSLSHLFAPTLDQLRERLREAVTFGFSDRFLISGLFLYLTDRFREWASLKMTAELDQLDRLKQELAVSTNQRQPPIPDDQLRDLISKIEEGLSRKRGQRENGEYLVRYFDEVQASQFDREYWLTRLSGGPKTGDE